MITPLLACGQCVDRSLFAVFPFAFYWGPALAVWSVVIGIPLSIFSYARKEALPMHPFRYFLLALALLFILGVPTMGSVALPLFLANSICLYRMVKSQRLLKTMDPAPTGVTAFAYRVQRIYLAVCFGIIPVAYIRFFIQRLLKQD